MDAAFREVLAGIADAVGDSTADIGTDHGRWRLYEAAMSLPTALHLLRQAVALEVDRSLAVSVVLRMLEQVSDDQQSDWINQLGPDNRAYSEKRAAELEILRRARMGALHEADMTAGLQIWTDWLQIRLVDALAGRETLAILSTKGRTKRIRNAAMTKLRTFRR